MEEDYCLRFQFQRGAVRHTKGHVLNVGSKEDPANLKHDFGPRVLNCDAVRIDHANSQPIEVDYVFDCTETWPFHDDSAELVVFGDILEHLTYEGIAAALREAARCARLLCITVPRDERITEESAGKSGLHVHRTLMSDDLLRELLTQNGWKPYAALEMDWETVPPLRGYGIEAHRAT